MFDPDTPPERRPIVVVDLGYRGLAAYIPGADVFMPIRRDMGTDPEGDGLSQDDRDYNAEISSIRIMVERAIGGMERYGLPPSRPAVGGWPRRGGHGGAAAPSLPARRTRGPHDGRVWDPAAGRRS